MHEGFGMWNPLDVISQNGVAFEEYLFFAKTMYAVSAFPFTILALPLEGLVFKVLSHARETGYDKLGQIQLISSQGRSLGSIFTLQPRVRRALLQGGL
jgi:hypothetical protein